VLPADQLNAPASNAKATPLKIIVNSMALPF
jgi:hypothetical protein